MLKRPSEVAIIQAGKGFGYFYVVYIPLYIKYKFYQQYVILRSG